MNHIRGKLIVLAGLIDLPERTSQTKKLGSFSSLTIRGTILPWRWTKRLQIKDLFPFFGRKVRHVSQRIPLSASSFCARALCFLLACFTFLPRAWYFSHRRQSVHYLLFSKMDGVNNSKEGIVAKRGGERG